MKEKYEDIFGVKRIYSDEAVEVGLLIPLCNGRFDCGICQANPAALLNVLPGLTDRSGRAWPERILSKIVSHEIQEKSRMKQATS